MTRRLDHQAGSPHIHSRELAAYSWVAGLPVHLMKGAEDLGTRFASTSLTERKLLEGQIRFL